MNDFLQFFTSLSGIALTSIVVIGSLVFLAWAGIRYIPNEKIGIIEKGWSLKGSLSDGDIVALNGEAGFQPKVLRGGFHFGYWRWQYAIHKKDFITVKQGKIGYIFSRIGNALPAAQTLAKIVECNNFQSVEQYLKNGGQKGRQRAILREGVYAINLSVFNIITEDGVFSLENNNKDLQAWQQALRQQSGFDPVVIGSSSNSHSDDIGIVTVHDGPALDGEAVYHRPASWS